MFCLASSESEYESANEQSFDTSFTPNAAAAPVFNVDVQDVQVEGSIDDIADLISGMKIQAENNEEEEDRDTTPTPQVDEEDKANNLLDISEVKNPPEAQPVEEFRSLEKLGKILTPVQKLKNAEKINGTPTDIEKIKLEKPTTPVKNEEDGEQVIIKFIFTIIFRTLFLRSLNHSVRPPHQSFGEDATTSIFFLIFARKLSFTFSV